VLVGHHALRGRRLVVPAQDRARGAKEICNNLDDDCNGQVDEMDPTPACTAQNPNAGQVQAWACSSGSCAIAQCKAGYANIDGAPGDGCECASDAYQTSCLAAGTQSVAKGTTVTLQGKVETANGSDYVKLQFAPTPIGQLYHPKIVLSDNAGQQYAMDVLADCNGVVTGPDHNGANIDTWEQSYFLYQQGAGCCSDNTPRLTSVIVRIYRRNADQPTCTSYTVTATNP
jgi:hypothetical protein